MTIISNSFSLACRLLLSKYTISTLQSIDSADNQHDYGCIWKLFRFRIFPFRGVLLQNLTDVFSDLDIILLIQIGK